MIKIELLTKKNVLILLFVCFSIINTLCLAETNTRITDIRFWQSPEEAQIVLDLTKPPKVTEVNLIKDGSLNFNIKNCSFRPGRQRYPLQNPFLEVLTVQEADKDMSVNVNFKTPAGVQAKTYVLPANERKGDRIVIFLREPAAKQKQKRDAELAEVKQLKSENVKIVVIDPGHGGEDPGTSGNGIVEKNHVMAMGKLVKAYFDRDPRFKAVLTRDGDYIIPLDRRRQIAEHLGADAFVSLHINYNHTKSIRGTEVYYESPKGAVGEAERLVAEIENRVDFADSQIPSPIDPALSKKELIEKQAQIMYKSRFLAEKTEAKLSETIKGLPSRGVKRAGFKVLHSLAMPSILVEFGYVSNSADAAILKNNVNRSKLAQGIYAGVADFLLSEIKDGIDEDYIAYCVQADARKAAAEKAERLRKEKAAKQAKLKKAKTNSTYKVKAGDTLSKIASVKGISLNSLLKANALSLNSVIKIGQVLKIPEK